VSKIYKKLIPGFVYASLMTHDMVKLFLSFMKTKIAYQYAQDSMGSL